MQLVCTYPRVILIWFENSSSLSKLMLATYSRWIWTKIGRSCTSRITWDQVSKFTSSATWWHAFLAVQFLYSCCPFSLHFNSIPFITCTNHIIKLHHVCKHCDFVCSFHSTCTVSTSHANFMYLPMFVSSHEFHVDFRKPVFALNVYPLNKYMTMSPRFSLHF